jgi:23S rRNA (pseudouridine1915-N3)-methyltransferase
MIPVTIISVGAFKNREIKVLCAEYQKRLAPYVRLNMLEMPASSFSVSSLEKAQATEEAAIAKKLEKLEGDVFLLSEDGGLPVSSGQFATDILSDDSREKIFVIGGATGFSPNFKGQYRRLSLSPLTFTHEMARFILLEQIYRATTISAGKTYHY